MRHRTVKTHLETSGPSAEFRTWGWDSVSDDDKREYADTVLIYRGTGTLETALGWIAAYWAGHAAWRGQRLDRVAWSAGAVRYLP